MSIIPVATMRTFGSLAKRLQVENIFQLFGKVGSEQPESALSSARHSIVRWIQQRCHRRLPASAFDGTPFEIELPGQRFAAVAVPDENLWSARLEHPDNRVGGRTWLVEVVLTISDNHAHLGVRTLCSTIGEPAPVEYTRPHFLVDIARETGLSEARQIDGLPWHLQSLNDLDELEQLLLDPDRRLQVILLTEADPLRVPFSVPRFLLDCDALAYKLLGAAFVVTLPQGLSFAWTDRVGKEWSAFQGAVRTYRPNLSFEQDDPRRHPVTFPERIICWADKEINPPNAFEMFLVQQTFRYAVRAIEWQTKWPSFGDVKARALTIAREQAKSDQEWKALYEDEITNLKQEKEEADSLAAFCSSQADQYEEQIQQYKTRIFLLNQELDRLRTEYVTATGGGSDASIKLPDALDELQSWAETYLTGRVVLHGRALRSAKKSRYLDVTLIYKALLLLAHEYRDMRMSRCDREQFEQAMNALGLELEPSITKGRAGEQGDEYYVNYPPGSSSNVLLDSHLKKGSTKDERYCLRIYFFWDPEEQHVVVGSLPMHLETRAS